ncbi:hypothetical protein Tco_0156286 [Tanacetum coccineum]
MKSILSSVYVDDIINLVYKENHGVMSLAALMKSQISMSSMGELAILSLDYKSNRNQEIHKGGCQLLGAGDSFLGNAKSKPSMLLHTTERAEYVAAASCLWASFVDSKSKFRLWFRISIKNTKNLH